MDSQVLARGWCQARTLARCGKFYWLDSLLKEQLVNNRMCEGSTLGRRMLWKLRQAEERGKDISGRQWVQYVLKNCAPDGRLKSYFDMTHLMQVKWLGDRKIETFLELFDWVLEGMDPKNRPSKDQLHELLFKQFKKTEKLKYDFEYYHRVAMDDKKKAKKLHTYKWIRRRLENFIAREDQDNIEHDWDEEVRRITQGGSNPAAPGISIHMPSAYYDRRSQSRERKRSQSRRSGSRRTSSGSRNSRGGPRRRSSREKGRDRPKSRGRPRTRGRGRNSGYSPGRHSSRGGSKGSRTSQRTSSSGVCRGWKKNGFCARYSKGKCKFKHPGSAAPAQPAKGGGKKRSPGRSQSPGRGTRANSPHPNNNKDELINGYCKWAVQGRCKFGKDCENPHPPDSAAAVSSGRKGRNNSPRKKSPSPAKKFTQRQVT